jgi:putative sterol carrier protein
MPTPEGVAAHWKEIVSLEGAQEYHDANAALMEMLAGQESAIRRQESAVSGQQSAERESKGGTPTVQAVFDKMIDAFQPEAAVGVDVVFQFNITGPGGGDWHVVVKDGECAVGAGAHDSPTTTLKMADDEFVSLIEGQLPAMQAYTTGKLRIEGDLMKSQLVEKLFKF